MAGGIPPSMPRDMVPARTRNRIVRSTRLTPEITQRICDLVRARVPPSVAARSLVSESVYYKWMALGREGKRKDCVDFMEAIEKAKAEAEMGCVIQIATAAKDAKHWTAAAWMLERHPEWKERWARVDHLEHTGKDGGPIQHGVLVVGGTTQEWVDACQRADAAAKAKHLNGGAPALPAPTTVDAVAVEVEDE